jgi:hypothetical protein
MSFDGSEEAVLMASNYRFFVKDATQVRVFSYDNTLYDANTSYGAVNTNYSTSVRIAGAATSDEVFQDDNLTGLAANINDSNTTTGVIARVLGDANTTLMLYYNGFEGTDGTRAGTIDMQEHGSGYDVFTEIYAENETNTSAKGAIARVWQISTIVEEQKDMNDSLGYTGIYSSISPDVSDLRFNAFYSENFPISGPLFELTTDLGVKAENIITGQTFTDGSYISWKQIDVSKDPGEWYDTDDQFELFWTEKEKGYWVYLNGESTNDLSIDTPSITGSTYAHFNNPNSSKTSGITRNHLNKSLSVTVSGLTDLGANANNDAYEVYANIGGVMTSFQRDGSDNDFTILLNSHETNGIGFDDGELEITITGADGSGKKVSTTYTLDYSKPVISSVSISGADATVNITNGDATVIHVYGGDINDSKYGSSLATNWAGSATVGGESTVANLGTMNGLTFPTSFEGNSSAYLDPASAMDSLTEQIEEGIIRDVRIVALDASGLYSDQKRLFYIPWKSGTGVLSDSSLVGDSTYDSAPVVYNNDATTNDTWTGNDGVQLSGNGSALTCVYPHEDVSYTEGTGEPRLLVTEGGTTIGSVIYSLDLVGNPLVCQSGTKVYVTGFADNGEGTEVDRLIMVEVSSLVDVTITK